MTGKVEVMLLRLKSFIFSNFSFNWKAEKTGEYIACFSNEFSTFSHKLVYIDFQVPIRPKSEMISKVCNLRLVTRIHCQGWRV